MPCFNCAERVAQSIESVLAQTFTDFELLVVDNASTDASRAVIASHLDRRVRLLTEQNKGVSHARNRGLAEASGEYIAFLDADDTWEPTFLKTMYQSLEHDPGTAIAYCGWQNLGLPGGRGQPFVPPEYETSDKCAQLIGGCRWPIHAALTRSVAIQGVKGFDPAFRIGEDFLLWTEIGCLHTIKRVPEVLAYYHHHGGEQATKDGLMTILETLRVQLTFLNRHPELRNEIGRSKIRKLTIGQLLQRGYEAYWKRDLVTARALFRVVMRAGYGRPRDWIYMLPALLPAKFHATLVSWFEMRKATLPNE